MRRGGVYGFLVTCAWQAAAWSQCAPAPDSAYFFRNLSEARAEAKFADNRAYFDQLLSESFVSKGRDGKSHPRQQYIDDQLAAGRALGERHFFSIHDYTLLEHRKGYTVASYRLIEGSTGSGAEAAAETWLREVYEVKDGEWHLTAVEVAAGAPENLATK